VNDRRGVVLETSLLRTALEQFGCCRGQRALLRLQIARPGTVATTFNALMSRWRKHHRVVNPRGGSLLTAVEILRSTRHGSKALRVEKHPREAALRMVHDAGGL
jgi:hypothetical protein